MVLVGRFTLEHIMKAILYARFSPRPNAAECESCESQIRELREYCQWRGHEIVGEFRDEALSGGDDWQDRPGMFDAATASKRGMLFLVLRYDRLFRDTRKALVFTAMLEAKGVGVIATAEPAANGSDPMAEMVRTIMLAIAQYQRQIIRARTKAKMLQHQANGRRMSAQCPWGWKPDPANPSRMVPCEEEREIARQICDFKELDLSFGEIAQQLEAAGKLRRGKPGWPRELVRRIHARFAQCSTAPHSSTRDP